MSTYLKDNGLNPTGTYYTFTQEQVDKLVIDFVESQTGFVLDLKVGCCEENYDVYVSWDPHDEEQYDAYFDSMNEKSILELFPQEAFLNRNIIFETMFNSQLVHYQFESEMDEPSYTFFVPGSIENEEVQQSETAASISFKHPLMGSYINRFSKGPVFFLQDIHVEVAGPPYNSAYTSSVICEIDSTTELQLCRNPFTLDTADDVWIEYKYYSPTQAKAKETKRPPARYKEHAYKLNLIFNQLFKDI